MDHARAEEHLGALGSNPVQSTPISNRATTQGSRRAADFRIPSLPTRQNAHRLLEAVTFYIGQAQCHFDARELLDRISYVSESALGPDELAKPEMLAALLVLAIGKLFVGEIDTSGEIPGTELFEFILGNFPTLGELYNLGRLGVEVTALVAVYMQNSNRREEAYIYVCQSTTNFSVEIRLLTVNNSDKHCIKVGYISWVPPRVSTRKVCPVREGQAKPALVDRVYARKVIDSKLVGPY